MRGLALMLALVVAGCSTPAGTLFRTTIVESGGRYPMPLAVGDLTGLVTGIEPADVEFEVGFGNPVVQTDPNNPNAVIVGFLTGACDDDTAVSFDRAGEAFSLYLDVRNGFDFSCSANAVLRGFRIRFSEPVEGFSVTATSKRWTTRP